MANNKHSSQADKILKGLSTELKNDPTSGASLFVDLLAMERLKARGILESVLKYSLIINVMLVGVVAYLATPITDVKVAQQRLDGSLAEIAITEKPFYKLNDVKDFARKRVLAVHGWSYSNYIQAFEDERQYWDQEPLDQYVNTLLNQGVFESAQQYRRRFEAFLSSSPKVAQQIKYDGQYRIYRVKITLTDESIDLEGVDSKDWEITLDIREVRPEEGWSGLKVSRYDEAIKQ